MADGDKYSIHADKSIGFSLKVGVSICGCRFTGAAERDGDSIGLSAYSDNEINISGLLESAAEEFGLSLEIPDFLDISVERLGAEYKAKTLTLRADINGFLSECEFSYKKGGNYLLGFSMQDFELKDIPFLSEFAGDLSVSLKGVSIVFTTKTERYHGVKLKPGLSFVCDLCGSEIVRLMKPYDDTKKLVTLGVEESSETVFWVDLNKRISILNLHRAGISYDGNNIGVMLDASVSIKPFTASLLGAGVRIDIGKHAFGFLLSGIGLEFDNGILTIGGAFRKSGDKYSGALTAGFASIKLTLFGSYEKGKLLAYALLNANLGGPPAFFVTGISAAFGYNKSIVIPDIEKVPEHPLVAAASGKEKMNLAQMIEKFDNTDYIADCEGQKILCAGVKFTTFNIIESFVLLNVEFGDKTLFSILGMSELSMPPRAGKNPIAYAKLALNAAVDPDEGVVYIQAQLMRECYILSRECKLTGGFAFFVWFGKNIHSGDFVLTLGGYHPSYAKPPHYPIVPRVGFNWRISSHISASGEVYFALTPSCIMAGARMSAVYQNGNLKAWFIAQADFFIGWKPFWYDAYVRASLGASYTLRFLGLSHTFTIELGADIYFWGPDFAGKVHISWFIISFTISFGDVDGSPPRLPNYGEFAESFLPKENKKESSANGSESVNPLTVSISGRIYKEKDGVKYVSADEIAFIVSSAVPISDGDVVIRPMGDVKYKSEITYDAGIENCTRKNYFQSQPTALWGGSGELREVQSGYTVSLPQAELRLFPATGKIYLEDLYDKNVEIYEGYKFREEEKREYTTEDTVEIFSETVNSDSVKRARREFLKKMGVTEQIDINLEKYSREAQTLFDEDILVII